MGRSRRSTPLLLDVNPVPGVLRRLNPYIITQKSPATTRTERTGPEPEKKPANRTNGEARPSPACASRNGCGIIELVPERVNHLRGWNKKRGGYSSPSELEYNPGMKLLLLVLPLTLLGCPGKPPAPPPGGDECVAAERRLLDLECKDRRGRLIGGPTLRNKPWQDVCRENTTNGVDMKAGCIIQSSDCDGVSRCR